LSEVNRSAGIAPVAIPHDLFDLLTTARGVSERTGGAFDVTWAALWGVWRFDANATLPDPAVIDERRKLIDWRDLVLDSSATTAFLKRKGMVVGLGGIGKGYALAVAANELKKRNFQNFLLYGGGQVYAGGTKHGAPWTVGVQDPRGEPGQTLAKLELRDASTSTSGDYEHYFIKDGVRYHHIIDPKTGYPTRGIASATVLSSDATLADAYSTAAVVLGDDKALALAQREHFDLLLIDDAGKLTMTDGLRARLTVTRDPSAHAR
jgi:thiamine biosynthesis lipoprotein